MPDNSTDINYVSWNPWHGCTKISPGCKYCYVYRQDEMYGSTTASSICKKNKDIDLPIRKKRNGSYKIPSGSMVMTCFTSDFLLPDADAWREDCWRIIRQRNDCCFYFFTKRIERLNDCLPNDWGDGYDNVIIGCTVENQDRADYRLPIFLSLPIKHRTVIVAPILEAINLEKYLDSSIEEVSVGGESGRFARPCRFEWIIDIREQCIKAEIPFKFHQTGANFIKDSKHYFIPRKHQHSQADKAGLDYRIEQNKLPNIANFEASVLQCKIEEL